MALATHGWCLAFDRQWRRPKRHRHRDFQRVLVAGVVVLGLAACSSPNRSSSDRTAATVGDRRSPATKRDALDLLAPDAPTRRAMGHLMSAEQDRIAQCMGHAAFTYYPVSNTSQFISLATPDGSPEIRDQYGYGTRVEPEVEKNDSYAQSLTTAENRQYSEALYGNQSSEGETGRFGMKIGYPTAGCIAEARAATYGSLSNYAKSVLLPQAYRAQAAAHTESLADYKSALGRWPRCMFDRFGVEFDTPSAYAQSAATLPLSAEIDASQNDLTCARETGLLRAVYGSYKSYVDSLKPNDLKALLVAAEAFRTASHS